MKKFFKNIKIIDVFAKHGTMKIMYVNFKTRECRSIYLQFSLQDPWWIPHYEKHFGKADIPLAGWLFFYFGVLTEAVIYPGDKDAKIVDYYGKRYYCQKFPSRKEADYYHQQVKKGKNFLIYEANGRVVVKQIS